MRNGNSPSTLTPRTDGGQLDRLSSAVRTRQARPCRLGNIDTVGPGIPERVTDFHEDTKQSESEQSQYPCIAQALVENDRGVEGVERRLHVVALEACAM